MSLLRDLLASFSGFFTSTSAPELTDPSPSAAIAVPPAIVAGRVALKHKGYFDLAKGEIDKAVRAEEWGLEDDAVAHYHNAQRVMLEAEAVRVPETLSSREQSQVNTYRHKILKWQEQVEGRLQMLTRRAVPSTKNSPTYKSSRPISSTVPAVQKATKRLPSLKSGQQVIRINNNSSRSSKLVQESTNYDPRLVEMINTVIVDRSPAIKWHDVAGLDKAKQTLTEMVILPTKRRDLFTGLRKPARGLLLFGPPGNGKTMLAKAVASESDATFFNVSAASLTSKWVGEAEKLVRTLFEVAAARQPSVIFMDEIDSILSTRVANENDASRRLKSEFLIQFDGVTSNQNALVIVLGATNKPQEIDDAVLRRLVKRIYIPLPDENVRRLLLKNQLTGRAYSLPSGDLQKLVKITSGYSGSDLQALCEEAALMPIRELDPEDILTIKASQVRPLKFKDFEKAMVVIRPSLQKNRWEELERWNEEYGSN